MRMRPPIKSPMTVPTSLIPAKCCCDVGGIVILEWGLVIDGLERFGGLYSSRLFVALDIIVRNLCRVDCSASPVVIFYIYADEGVVGGEKKIVNGFHVAYSLGVSETNIQYAKC